MGQVNYLIPPLRLGGVSTTAAGFISVVPVLNLGGGGTTTGGWISPIPTLNLGATAPVVGGPEERGRRTYFTYIGRTRLGR